MVPAFTFELWFRFLGNVFLKWTIAQVSFVSFGFTLELIYFPDLSIAPAFAWGIVQVSCLGFGFAFGLIYFSDISIVPAFAFGAVQV